MLPTMTATAKQKLLGQQHTQAMTRYLDERGVALLHWPTGEPKPNGTIQGSGTCVRIGERYLIATASHVVRDHQEARIAPTDIFIVTDREKRMASERVPIKGIGSRGGGQFDDVDVGWLELEPAVATKLARDWVTIEQFRLRVAELPSDMTFVYGCPAELIDEDRMNERFHIHVRPFGYASGTLDGTERPNRGTLAHDLFVYYSLDGNRSTDGVPAMAPHPHGLSGCAIWALDANREGLWTPQNAKLIGIEHSWLKKENWIRGTQIQHWLELVRDDIPTLRTAIDPVVATP
jgi:hypothetical protein